jgi:hypothetical protein
MPKVAVIDRASAKQIAYSVQDIHHDLQTWNELLEHFYRAEQLLGVLLHDSTHIDFKPTSHRQVGVSLDRVVAAMRDIGMIDE